MWTDHEAVPPDVFVDDTRQRQPTRAPYEKFAYSNLGYSLLGNVIEAVTGSTWADYVQQQILDPLGMTGDPPYSQPGRSAACYWLPSSGRGL